MEIRTEDLWRKCTACGGDGVFSLPRESDEIELAATKCDCCGGRGMMLTDSGTVLKAFFQMFQDGKI